MPEFKQSLSLPGHAEDDLMAIGYGTFRTLNWNLKYAGPGRLAGYTPRSWKSQGQEIMQRYGFTVSR